MIVRTRFLTLLSFKLILSFSFLFPLQVYSLPVAQVLTFSSEMRRSTLFCSRLLFFHVSTTASPPRSLWCSGCTSRTAATALVTPSTCTTAQVEVWEHEEVGQWASRSAVEGTRPGWWRVTWTALTTAGRSEPWPLSPVPQSHSQSTTRTETSPLSTVSCFISFWSLSKKVLLVLESLT